MSKARIFYSRESRTLIRFFRGRRVFTGSSRIFSVSGVIFLDPARFLGGCMGWARFFCAAFFQFFFRPAQSLKSSFIFYPTFGWVRQEFFCLRLEFSECKSFLGLVSYFLKLFFSEISRRFLRPFWEFCQSNNSVSGDIFRSYFWTGFFLGRPDIFRPRAKKMPDS